MTDFVKLTLTFGASAIVLAACSKAEAPKAESKSEPVKAEASAPADSDSLCLTMGPQTPRDISSKVGLNTTTFAMAPASTEMNLCNIHTHTNAEHKGPGFSVFVNDSEYGGYACNRSGDLTEAELAPYADNDYRKVKPGNTIEVHWVHTSCDAKPGKGLGACVPETCESPTLRVETQVFLVVNDRNAANFMDYGYSGSKTGGLHQPKSLPTGTGAPVQFLGSTTGPSYTQTVCSPAQVTWSVRPQCQKLDIASLDAWAESGNVFKERKSHGVRQLVTAPELLSAIK